MQCHTSFARRAQNRTYKAGQGGLPDADAVFVVLDTNVMVTLAATELAYQRKNPDNKLSVAQAFLRADKQLTPELVVTELLRTRQIFTAANETLRKEWDTMISDLKVRAQELVQTDPTARKAFVKRIQAKCLPLDAHIHASVKCKADPNDQMLLDTAAAARKAGYTRVVILTHDHHLRDMAGQLQGLYHVMTPKEFIKAFPQIAPQKEAAPAAPCRTPAFH